MNNTTILRARELRKSFRMGSSNLEVLRGVDIDLTAGEVSALRGSSGSGKSTLLHLLGLLDPPDSGVLELHGKPCHALSASKSAKLRAQQIGFVFQQFQLLPELDALQNVLMPRRLAMGLSWWSNRKDEYQKAIKLLKEVGLEERIRHLPNQLSGGEQQRVAVARALISRPALLLADEPTGNLDTQTGKEVLQLLLGMARERSTTVLIATHSHTVAESCDQTLHLVDGQLQTQ